MSEAVSPEKTTTHEEAEAKTKVKAEMPVHQTPPQYERKSYKTFWISSAIVVGILLILGLGVTSGMLIENSNNKSNSSTSLTSAQDGNTTVTQQESDIASVAEKVSPSVVSVVTQTQTQSYYGSTSSGEAAGTGIIVSKDGYVMTNNHVVENASTVSVVDNDGNLYQNVSVIGRDPLNDIAFLKIKANKTFSAATLGNSSTIRIGQQVVAIGNALGQYSNTVTSGIISGTGRPVTASSSDGSASETLTDLIQTDASINPGNSGGPLLNMSGQVIGINTAIVQDANGIGFAIPINSTKGVLAGVLETGKVSRAYLGVNYLSITADIARQYNLSVNQGAYVYTNGSSSPVASGSPAEQAGLKLGDVITKVNDISVGTDGSLSSIIGEFKPGDTVTLTFIRNGQTQTTQVTFGTYQ
ncbi:MAG TPA: trypsin-like peptidase domain-containing protein [Dongiaceae bacterium]|nr:trypsin-like peptidase domain-containing protein [Dongiaceae bacterium]